MLLAIDVGNTLTNFGVWNEETLLASFVLDSDSKRSEDETKSRFKMMLESFSISFSSIDEAIISSVVPTIGKMLSNIVEELFGIKAKTVGPGLKSGLHLKVDNPLEVGADLVSDGVGAKVTYGSNLFIADLGTASKYIYIDEDGAFAGLSIAPGMSISLNALVNDTAALPMIPLEPNKKVMGKNTIDCMNSGIIHGTAFEVMGFAKAFEKEAGKSLKKILTGGNAIYIKGLLEDFIYDKDLLMKGLFDINKRNKR